MLVAQKTKFSKQKIDKLKMETGTRIVNLYFQMEPAWARHEATRRHPLRSLRGKTVPRSFYRDTARSRTIDYLYQVHPTYIRVDLDQELFDGEHDG